MAVFSFLRKLHTVSHKSYTKLHSHQQFIRVSLSTSLKMFILTYHHVEALICISLIII